MTNPDVPGAHLRFVYIHMLACPNTDGLHPVGTTGRTKLVQFSRNWTISVGWGICAPKQRCARRADESILAMDFPEQFWLHCPLMKKSLKYREIITDVRRVVIKIGSRVLVQKNGRPDKRRMRSLIREVSAIQATGRDVVLVTSGAVGAGMAALGMKERPSALPDLQMAAAVGQTRLMNIYSDFFGQYGCTVGQVLLTHANFRNKVCLTNARRTMENLIRNNVIPIVNENDVVSSEEIRADNALGDNDYLASLVVKLIRADLLLLLTTVDGLREPGSAGRTRRVRYLESVSRKTFQLDHGKKSGLSTGGIATKLKAADAVSKTGCSVVIADGRQTGVLGRIMGGDDVGTIILASGI